MAGQNAGYLVIVHNLPYTTTEQDLGSFFSTAGAVTNVRLVYDQTNRPKGYGLCEFADEQGALNAVSQLNGANFNGRALCVKPSNRSDGWCLMW